MPPLNVPVGKASRIDGPPEGVRWLLPPGQDSLQVLTYSDHAIVVPQAAGTFYVGFDRVNVADPATWTTIVAGGKTPGPSWIDGVGKWFASVPWSTVYSGAKTATFVAMAAVLLFVVFGGSIHGCVPPGPTPDPTPTPTPTPTPPAPQPVKSFHVIFIYESAKTLTAQENSVMRAKVVRDWLATNTTPEGGWQGWREWDKDSPANNETLLWRELWAAIQPKITTVPSVAIEVNGRVEIIPLAATPAEMVAVFEKYKGGK